ncbi:MAG: TIR domain-containing protein [Oscillospiraceae bacterium]|nr:TIR domain-containing protein [Oscillospiraceae bacterium]
MNTKEMKPYIFISYAHDDAVMARKITEFLQNEGFEVWIDYNGIRAGGEFNDKIAQAIYNSSLFISLVSNTYISKPFCGKEIEYAHNRQKNCMTAYIEAVTPPPGHALDFIFNSASQAGYNKDIQTDDDFKSLCQAILNSECIEHMKKYIGKGATAPMPYIRPSAFNVIEEFYRKITRGNYYLSNVVKELFPPFVIDEKTETSENNNELLIKKLSHNSKTNFILIGDGGSGKTVALRSIFKYFIGDGTPAIYIPLNKIMFSERITILSYLEDELSLTWDVIKRYGRCETNNRPLRILFDGLNETQGDRKKILSEICDIMRWSNVQVIISSRNDFSESLAQDISFKKIELKPLEENVVKLVLENAGINYKANSKILLLLSNPLMLTLYMNTDPAIMDMYKPLSKYENYYKINISKEPASSSEIIWNFLQSQLYRADETPSSQFVYDTFVLIEYILPIIANHMLINNKIEISKAQFLEILTDIPNREDYKYYYNNRIAENIEFALDADEYELKKNNIRKTLFNKLSLMVESDDRECYEFFHQSFRDFFSAMFISKKLEMLANKKPRTLPKFQKYNIRLKY